MREKARSREASADDPLAVARPRSGRGAGRRRPRHPPQGAARGRDRHRRPGAGPRRVPEQGARRPHHPAQRRQSHLQSRRRRRRSRHGRHARHSRRRSPDQCRAADADLSGAWAGACRIWRTCRSFTDRTAPSSRSATARWASRTIAPWATCRRRCATTSCGSAGATATTRSCRPTQCSTGSTSTTSTARAARFDFAKLDDLNGHYIRDADDRAAATHRGPAALSAGRRGDRRRASRPTAGEASPRHAGPEGARQDAGRAGRTAPPTSSPSGRSRSMTRRRSCSTPTTPAPGRMLPRWRPPTAGRRASSKRSCAATPRRPAPSSARSPSLCARH